VAATPEPGRTTLLVACRNNAGVAEMVRARFGRDAGTQGFDVDCAGTLHPGTVSYLAGHFRRTIVIGCPPQNCVHREGSTLAYARILEERRPAIPNRIKGQAVRMLQCSASAWPSIVAAIEDAAPPARRARGAAVARAGAAVALTAVLLALVALGSRWPQGGDADHALLRLGWRLAGQVRETCRDLAAEELARRPVHMRTPRECVSEVLAYELTAVVDGHVVAQKTVRSPGFRADRPLSVEENVRVTPGEHVLKVTFRPEDPASGGKVLVVEGRARFDRKRVVLVTYDNEALVIR
jgi:hypothetical protein